MVAMKKLKPLKHLMKVAPARGRDQPPVDVEGIGASLNLTTTKRTQSRNGGSLLNVGHL
jgi:hypothetical protein